MMRLGSRRLLHLAPAERQPRRTLPTQDVAPAPELASGRAQPQQLAVSPSQRGARAPLRPHRVNRHQAIPSAVRSRSSPNHGDKDEPRSGLHHTPPDLCSIRRHPSQGCSPAATAYTTPAIGHGPPRDGILGGKRNRRPPTIGR
jgi:hypothetical protein